MYISNFRTSPLYECRSIKDRSLTVYGTQLLLAAFPLIIHIDYIEMNSVWCLLRTLKKLWWILLLGEWEGQHNLRNTVTLLFFINNEPFHYLWCNVILWAKRCSLFVLQAHCPHHELSISFGYFLLGSLSFHLSSEFRARSVISFGFKRIILQKNVMNTDILINIFLCGYLLPWRRERVVNFSWLFVFYLGFLFLTWF